MLLFIKLGGSVLTDKTRPETLNEPVLRAVIAELVALRQAQPNLQLLLGHGGGSFGHHWAARYRLAHGIQGPQGWEGFARVTDAMARLNRAVVGALLDAGLPAVGIQPSASARSRQAQLVELATEPIRSLLAAGAVPVIYGDAVLDELQGAAIASTEALFSYLALRLAPQRMVLVGEAAVYTADPHRAPQAQPIPEINAGNYQQVLELLGGSHGVDVTGGMRSKVESMWALVQALPGLSVALVGPQPAALRAALRGQAPELGTIIRA